MQEKINIGSYTFTVENGVLLRTTGPKDCTDDMILPEGITAVGKEGARTYGAYPNRVVIPDSVTEVEERGVYYFYKTTEIVFSKNLKRIGKEAFGNLGAETVDLPASLTELGEEAFSGSHTKNELRLPTGLKSIPKKAFANTKISAVLIPDTVERLEIGCFSLCVNMKNVTFGNGVKQVEKEAFEYCYSLSALTIPKSVTHIGEHAFAFCKNLKEIIFEGTDFVLGAEIFNGIVGEIRITYPGTREQIEAILNADCFITDYDRDSYYGEPVWSETRRYAAVLGRYGEDAGNFTCTVHCLADNTTKTYSCCGRGPAVGRPSFFSM